MYFINEASWYRRYVGVDLGGRRIIKKFGKQYTLAAVLYDV